jgi:hypothetical protein
MDDIQDRNCQNRQYLFAREAPRQPMQRFQTGQLVLGRSNIRRRQQLLELPDQLAVALYEAMGIREKHE